MEVEGVYALKQFQELCRIHSMTILIHSRTQYSRDLARKLRPEFSKLLLTTDVKVCIKLITRRNADPSGVGGIDLVIIDYDQNSLRLLEYINKRPLQEETLKQPLIPTILLLPEPTDPGTLETIEAVGGANAIVSPPFRTAYIFSHVIDILHRRRQLDGTFRDLRQDRVKYPFLPVFTVSRDEIEREIRDASAHQGSVVLLEERDAIFDDWVECESLMGADLISIRKMERERRNSSREGIPQRDRLAFEIAERINVDRILSRSAHLALAELHGIRAEETEVEALIDRDELSIDSGEEEADAGKSSKPVNGSNFNLKSLTSTDSCDVLLDPSRRPKWFSGGGANDISSDLEMRPFIDRAPPNLKIAKTADGLDKKFVERCWTTIKGPMAAPKTTSKLLLQLPSKGMNGQDGGQESSRLGSAKQQSGRLTPGMVRMNGNGIGSSEFIDSDLKPLKPKNVPAKLEISTLGATSNSVAKSTRRGSTTRMSISSTCRSPNNPLPSVMSSSSSQLDDSTARRELTREKDATRAIAKLARCTAHDLHFVPLDDLVECMHRQLNQGERDLLEEGIRVEKEEDLDRAYVFFSRAGLHSHEPHLSKIFLGNLFFKKRNFLNAIKYYSGAIDLIEALRGHSENYENDSFRAHYNRAMAHIVCGDDEAGIKDLEKAVALKPEHIKARDTFAVALRRIGRFDSAIVQSLKCVENIQAAELEAKNQALEAALNAVSMHTGHPSPSGGPSLSSSHSGLVMFPTIPEDGSVGPEKVGPAGGRSSNAHEHGPHGAGLSRQPSSKITQIGQKDGMHKTREQFLEEAENRAIASRTTVVAVTDSRGSLGFKERKEVALKRAFGHGDQGDNASSRMSLVAFKMKNGFKPDLFEHLFFKPNPLQEALAHAPGSRRQEHISTIASTLHLIPLFSTLTEGQILDLASCIEYRPVTSKGQLFIQNSPASGMCVILKGSIDIKIEAEQHTTRNLLVGQLGVFDSIGFTDMLFRQDDTKLWTETLRVLRVDASTAIAAGIAIEIGVDQEPSEVEGIGLGSGFSVIESPSEINLSSPKESSVAISAKDTHLSSASTSLPSAGNLTAAVLASHHTRAKAPGMFATYFMTTLCELLLIDAEVFARILYQTAVDEFLKRLTVLQVCGVFNGLSWLDIVRLARMCQVLTYNSGDIILRQGSKPNFIYFVMDGLCQVWAQANNAEIYERQLNELQDKARRHDLKYTYHHKLKTTYRRSDLPQVKQHRQLAALTQQRKLHAENDPTAGTDSDLSMDLQWETNITSAEILRQELGLEIEQVKLKLARARALETTQSSKSEQKVWTANDAAMQCEVKVLRWPMLFGEASILDPDTGTSRGTVVASTCCHILVLHKTQIQTFHISDDLLAKIRLRAVVYPDDKTIEQNLSRGKAWKDFKAKEMTRIRTTRWPKLNSDQEPFIL